MFEFVLGGWCNIVLVGTVIIVCFASLYIMGNSMLARIDGAAGNLWGIGLLERLGINDCYGGDLQPEKFACQKDIKEQRKVVKAE